MGRFKIDQNWGNKSMGRNEKSIPVIDTNDYEFLQKYMVRTPNTIHHQPEKHQLKAAGKVKLIALAGIPMTHELHAMFHEVSESMYHTRGDHDAVMGELSNMNEQEAANYEEICDLPELRQDIRNLIISRRRKFGLG